MTGPPIVNIARCPEHGIHGERQECFVCGGQVQQLPMIHVADLVAAAMRNAEILSALNTATGAMAEVRSLLTPGMRAGTAEACALLDRARQRIAKRLEEAGIA